MADVDTAHKRSSNHRSELEGSHVCGCFYCLAVFPPAFITDWVDWPADTPDDQQLDAGTTALCPQCGVDSVIGSSSGYPITTEFLGAMQRRWFET